MFNKIIQKIFTKFTTFKANPYHPLVWINGNPKIGKNVVIAGFSEINANHVNVTIGDNCDIASFVTINAADSHKKCLGLSDEIERKDITIGEQCFYRVTLCCKRWGKYWQLLCYRCGNNC